MSEVWKSRICKSRLYVPASCFSLARVPVVFHDTLSSALPCRGMTRSYLMILFDLWSLILNTAEYRMFLKAKSFTREWYWTFKPSSTDPMEM